MSGNDSNASDAGTKPRTKKQRCAEWLPNKCKTYLQFDNSNKETYKQFRIYIKEMIKSLNIKSHRQCGDTTWNKLQSALYRWLYKHDVFGGYIINLPNSTDWDAKQEDVKKAVYDLCLDVFKAVNQVDNDVVFQQEIAHGR